MLSPTRTSRDGFAGWPLTLTRPFPISSLDRPRVLKKRAAHSHLSSLTPVIHRLLWRLRQTARLPGPSMGGAQTHRPGLLLDERVRIGGARRVPALQVARRQVGQRDDPLMLVVEARDQVEGRAAGGQEGGTGLLADFLERLEAVGREARAHHVD